MRTHTTSTLKTLILNDMDPSKHTMTKQEIDTWIQMIPGIFGDMVKYHLMIRCKQSFEKLADRKGVVRYDDKKMAIHKTMYEFMNWN